MNKMLSPLVLLAALAAAGAQADVLPAGTVITGTVSGASNSLLGLDSLFSAGPGSHVTTLAPAELEYLSGDFAIGIDFFGDGTVQFYGNTDNGALPGSYTFSFSFAGLAQDIGGFNTPDLGTLLGGSVSTSVIDGHTVSITLTDVQFNAAYASFSAQLQAVPEPAPLGLLSAGLVALWAQRRRAARGV